MKRILIIIKQEFYQKILVPKCYFHLCVMRYIFNSLLNMILENLQVAHSKLVRAEDTSELSCYDADKSTRRKRHQTQVSDNESEYDYEKKNFNYKTKKKSNLKNGAPIQSNLSEPPMFWNIDGTYYLYYL